MLIGLPLDHLRLLNSSPLEFQVRYIGADGQLNITVKEF
jgi:hypothetical protein